MTVARIVVLAGLAAALLSALDAYGEPAAWAAPSSSTATLLSRPTPTGPVLTNADGRTLYVFVDDLITKAPSACTGDCTHDWLPALAPLHIVVGPGVTGTVGTVVRSDGRRQLTMDGRPLYTFSGDRAPGEVRGNGIGNLWWAMTPSGLTATLYAAPKSSYGPAAPTTLTVVRTAAGPVVANSHGQVLYDYTDDSATKSACVADWCLVDWPPLQVSGAPSVPATITATVGVLDRPDGITQVELGGHPLYTFAGDLRPGDARGQGIGHDWYLVSPAGQTVKTPLGSH